MFLLNAVLTGYLGIGLLYSLVFIEKPFTDTKESIEEKGINQMGLIMILIC